MDLRDDRFKLNREIPIPLYYQVKRMVLNELANGNLKLGDKLPAEVEFCERLQLSRSTVRLALNELVAEGVLVRKKRSGTFVAEPKIELSFDVSIESFQQRMQNSSRLCRARLLDLCVVDGIDEINKRLLLSHSDRLIYLKRLWTVGDTPIVYNATYLPERFYDQLRAFDFSAASLYDALSSAVAVKSRSAKIESVLASRNDIELLEISRTRAVLLYVAELALGAKGDPVCWSISRYRGDKVFLSCQDLRF